MNYKITEHYERGEEKLIAAFNELNDVRLFMTKKSSIDEENKKKIIYRVYDNYELLHEVNNQNIFVTHANYAEGNSNLNNTAPFIFQVMMKPKGDLERKTIAQFNDKQDAHLFIICKFESDKTVHDNDLLFIVKNKIVIDAVNKAIHENRERESQSPSDNEKRSTYQLSPLSTRPTPRGGPPDYWVETEDDVEK